MIRVIHCRAGDPPIVTWLAPDGTGDCHPALELCLGGPVTALPLYDGVGLWCSRSGWLFGLTLTRRVLAGPGTAAALLVETRRRGSEGLPAHGDFVLSRVSAHGGLADLDEGDIRHWMFWLGLDHVMGR